MVDLCPFAFISANLAACLLPPSIWMTFSSSELKLLEIALISHLDSTQWLGIQ
jgi:hypothetical protein